MTDERVNKIAGRATRISYFATALATALLGMILIGLGKNRPDFLLAGNILAYIACASIIIYVASFCYFNNKTD